MIFRDREDAGRQLADKLLDYANRADVLVLGLPRGGVATGYEVARALHVPLDVFVVRKLGLPEHKELAMGAIATGGVQVLNEDVIRTAGVSEEIIAEVAAMEKEELRRRERLYRGDRPAPDLRDKTVLLVDDGLATGSTMRAAVAAIRRQAPRRIVVAVPVSARETCAELRAEADVAICVKMPEPFYAIGIWYENFAQMSDEQVRELLEQALRNLNRGEGEAVETS
jgi:putative phosphoribosyl transferase